MSQIEKKPKSEYSKIDRKGLGGFFENVLRKFELKNRVEAAIYGLIASGCPHDSNSACPLKLWQNGHDAEAKVGHSPKPERWRV